MKTAIDPRTTLEIPLVPRRELEGESFVRPIREERIYTDGFRAGRAGAPASDAPSFGTLVVSGERRRSLWELGRSDGARKLAAHRSQLSDRYGP